MTLVSLQNIGRLSGALVIGLGLSACGGGGGGGGGTTEPAAIDPVAYTPLSNRAATDDTILVFLGTTNTGALRFGNAGTLDHINNTLRNGLLAGTTNNGRTTIMLDGGGEATLTNPEGTAFVRVFTTQGAGDPIIGVVGQQTGPSAIPESGSTRYNGQVDMTVADGGPLRSLTGDVEIVASWSGGGSATATFDAFRDGGSNVNGQIRITDANITNSGFRGGSLTTSGALFDVTGSADISGTRGYFFGPNADEVGGTLVIDDQSRGSLKIVGVYVAD